MGAFILKSKTIFPALIATKLVLIFNFDFTSKSLVINVWVISSDKFPFESFEFVDQYSVIFNDIFIPFIIIWTELDNSAFPSMLSSIKINDYLGIFFKVCIVGYLIILSYELKYIKKWKDIIYILFKIFIFK